MTGGGKGKGVTLSSRLPPADTNEPNKLGFQIFTFFVSPLYTNHICIICLSVPSNGHSTMCQRVILTLLVIWYFTDLQIQLDHHFIFPLKTIFCHTYWPHISSFANLYRLDQHNCCRFFNSDVRSICIACLHPTYGETKISLWKFPEMIVDFYVWVEAFKDICFST